MGDQSAEMEEDCLIVLEKYAAGLKLKKQKQEAAFANLMRMLKSLESGKERDMFVQRMEARFV